VGAISGARSWDDVPATAPSSTEDGLLTLWIAHEQHHRGFPGASDAEWVPELLVVRGRIERELEARLRERAIGRVPEAVDPDALLDFVHDRPGRSLAAFVQRSATESQV